MKRLIALAAACFLHDPTLAEVAIPQDLATYLARPEPAATWSVAQQQTMGNCEVLQLKLTSQTWQGLVWEHDLVIFIPSGASSKTVVLLNEGGKADSKNALMGTLVASKVKAPVAILLGVPRQPLFDGKSEDDLIAETFVRYLETGDGSWPLLFPMVKSLIKAMDAIQELSTQKWSEPTERFIVGGASKRGWTTWLAAASDPRVMAITPMVIDTLNMQAQLPHQIKSFGGPSEQIEPYTKRGLVPLPDTSAARKLWNMVDPWAYRAKFTMPKLVVLGNNDRYWSTDALNLYWDDLPGDKYLSYTPNAGHDLTERTAQGKKLSPMRALNNVGAFVRHLLTETPMPKLSWKHDDAPDGQLRLTVTAYPKPKQAQFWVATGPTRDLREARWEARPLEVPADGPLVVTLPRPHSGHTAFFADLGYQIEDIPQWLSTQLRIANSETTLPQ
jgi:PhoPQ-activated pathogenicity-related protein